MYIIWITISKVITNLYFLFLLKNPNYLAILDLYSHMAAISRNQAAVAFRCNMNSLIQPYYSTSPTNSLVSDSLKRPVILSSKQFCHDRSNKWLWKILQHQWALKTVSKSFTNFDSFLSQRRWLNWFLVLKYFYLIMKLRCISVSAENFLCSEIISLCIHLHIEIYSPGPQKNKTGKYTQLCHSGFKFKI